MDKNCVKRRGAPDELASDSEVQKWSKRLYVNAARVRGKRSYLIRGGLSLSGGQKSAEAIVVDGVATIQEVGETQLQGEGLNGRADGQKEERQRRRQPKPGKPRADVKPNAEGRR